ncbi:MAG TPA: hypothetical protein VKV95_02585 [Terriglobia bacterium]|nr:hypothetical protein [Terriglobia bacterium]
MQQKTYIETFDKGPGGWFGWISNLKGPAPLEIRDSAAISRSPWWIDYNHAPPGAGYLHMLYCLMTSGVQVFTELYMEVARANRFVEGNFPTDFTNAKLSVRLKGELELRGASLVLLVQGKIGNIASGWMLTGHPLVVTPEWTEQTIIAAPDPKLWTCLGSRHDRQMNYGEIDFLTILRDVNANIMLVLFPLIVAPMGHLDGDPHILRPEKDYPVWRSRLPEGYVLMDEIRIEFDGGYRDR